MRSFREAHLFMAEKSALEIFFEILPYIVEAESKGKGFGHDRIAILVAAFGGNFDKEVFHDPPICDLLEISDWGWHDHGPAIVAWGEKYARTTADQRAYSLICNLLRAKSDDVYHYLNENARTGFAFRPGWQVDK